MLSSWQFSTAGSVVFGRDSSKSIHESISRRGWKRILVVTDRNLMKLSQVQQILGSLSKEGRSVSVFDGVQPEPAVSIPIEASILGGGDSVDCVVAIGGGSNIDVAKMAAVLIRHGGAPKDYFGFDRIPGPTVPVVAVPTTAGTGSEVSHSSVLTDQASANKVSSLSPYLRPAIAVIDPALTDSCPRKVTADSGIDALVHAIEAYTAKPFDELGSQTQETRAYSGSNPMGDMLALEAIRLIGENLAIAVEQPSNRSARDSMAWAACLAGMAFSNSGVALVHALEYPIGAAVHCSHGEGNGLLLPHVMRFNLPNCVSKMAKIALTLGYKPTTDEPDLTIAEGGIEFIRRLSERIGIAPNLKSLGVERTDLEKYALASSKIERLVHINPRLSKFEDLLQILKSAYDT